MEESRCGASEKGLIDVQVNLKEVLTTIAKGMTDYGCDPMEVLQPAFTAYEA